MTWFKVDDKLHDHRKAHEAGARAMGVWLLAGSWSADNLTDGFIPERVLRRWGTTRDAKTLVSCGLWSEISRENVQGWTFNDWSDYQPTSEAVEAKRLEARERMARVRANKTRSSQNVRSTPSRPVPSRPIDTPNGVSTNGVDSPSFDAFWAEYPRKVGKGQARKAWATALGREANAQAITDGASRFAKWCELDDTESQFIPHPSTWLNGERWTDERPTQTNGNRPPRKSTTDERFLEASALAHQLRAEEAAQASQRKALEA